MTDFTFERIHDKYHSALLDWQHKNFPELNLLEKNWDKYFSGVPKFELAAKVGGIASDTIEVGALKGQKKFERAGDLKGNMFFTAQTIIRAQASTELGSIQQHRLTLEQSVNDRAKYAVMRIMAEELRHAYQMFWVLDHDPTWRKLGMGDVAAETMDELLAMQTGKHVLDAFNIEFDNFLDNVTYATVIDLVGKYQLDMQKVFAYAPVGRSMGPMFDEERFHLGSGRKHLKEIALDATNGRGDFSIEDVQRALNCWLPRGLEMFGNETGGETVVQFGFKDRMNGVAQQQYIDEVKGVVRTTNIAIVREIHRDMLPQDAEAIANEVLASRDTIRGIKPEMLVRMPDKKFFRRRGTEHVMQPRDIDGNLMTEGGKPLDAAGYLKYLEKNLPAGYLKTSEFAKFRDALVAMEKGEKVDTTAKSW
jgi:1,2-phenylacetyl-CoA epoxidase catalytic subunit